jgi:hypothetical protein
MKTTKQTNFSAAKRRQKHKNLLHDLSCLGFEPLGKWRKGFANGKGREAD